MVEYEPMKKPLTVRMAEALGWLYVILTVVLMVVSLFCDLYRGDFLGAVTSGVSFLSFLAFPAALILALRQGRRAWFVWPHTVVVLVVLMVAAAGCLASHSSVDTNEVGCVASENDDYWLDLDWRGKIFSMELTQKMDSIRNRLATAMVECNFEKDRRKANKMYREVAVRHLPALMALRQEIAAVNVHADKTNAKKRILEEIDDEIVDVKCKARDLSVMALEPCAKAKGVSFMGFDFDSEVEWDAIPRQIMDGGEDSDFFCREYELKKPYHGFETVEVRGGILSRRSYALVFSRQVVGKFDIETAQRWTDELARDFPGDCGIKLKVSSKTADWVMLKGESDKLRVWACAGAYTCSGFSIDGKEYDEEKGIHYQLDIRRKAGRRKSCLERNLNGRTK